MISYGEGIGLGSSFVPPYNSQAVRRRPAPEWISGTNRDYKSGTSSDSGFFSQPN